MKVYHLGLIILGIILIITIISSYKEEDSKDETLNQKDGFDIDKYRENRKKQIKKRSDYWTNRLHPNIKTTNGAHLNMRVIEGNTNLKDTIATTKIVNPGVTNVEEHKITKQINKCESYNLNDEADCSLLTDNNCGYCVEMDKIFAHDKDNSTVLGNVCITSNWKSGDGTEKNQGEWIPPGSKAAYLCQKKKEQRICKRMKNCGDNIPKDKNGKSYPNVKCAWCPATGSGVPAKTGPDGGLVPKYDDDKCEWVEEYKNKRYPTSKTQFLGWSPSKGGYPKRGTLNPDGSMTPAPKPYGAPLDKGEGDCDRDSDCGPGLKCGHDGRNMKRIVGADGKELKPNAGYKDYCYDPNQWPFQGSLIKPSDCEKFGQLFPCVGKNMFKGPHSDACLEDLWKNSGCYDSVFERSSQEDKKKWNSASYLAAENNMVGIRETAKTSKNYKKANKANKKCFNREFSPCLDRFYPRPIECSQKIYNETGCKEGGKLNPKNISGVNDYASSSWIAGQNGRWTQNQYKNDLLNLKRKSRSGLINPKLNDFDNTIDSNMKCFGKIPGIPFDKPCWKDFMLMMKCMDGVKIINTGSDWDSLSFDGATNFKSLLAQGEPNNKYWKNKYTWKSNSKSNFIITNDLYKQEHFPFWNFINISKSYWNNNWGEFSNKLLKSRFISKDIEKVNAKWVDSRGGSNLRDWTPNRKLKKGEGDCDNDNTCLPGLKCAQNPLTLVGVNDPGNIMKSGRDFCYDPMDNEISKGNIIKFSPGSGMEYLAQSTNINRANDEGKFLKRGNNLYLSQKAYQTENFPYWLFLDAAEKLGF